MVSLVGLGVSFTEINVGGLHYRDGARHYLDYLYVTPDDIEAFRTLAGAGITLTAQDLPGNPSIELNPRLLEGRLAYDRLPARRP
jgi:mannose/fructose/N-acetylgalactosamine-specific phosphotransferase system component IIB